MSSESLWIQIPLIIGIPTLALFAIILIKGATSARRPGTENAVEWGMDFAVLATGACGAIFANDTIYKKWGIGSVVYGIGTTVLCIVFIAVLSVIRRWQAPPVSLAKAIGNFIIGLIPLGLVTAILIIGYTATPRR
jgi:hypothetical protein